MRHIDPLLTLTLTLTLDGRIQVAAAGGAIFIPAARGQSQHTQRC